jgi:hypothetical protein
MTDNSANNLAEEQAKYAGLSPEEKLAVVEAEKLELEKKLKDLDDNTGIPLDAYIEVMSLVPFKLNLSTERLGKGRQFSFSRFGEVKRILYNDLASIFENYRSFMEQGYFFIMNAKVVRKHGLDDIYEKILSKEKIEKILSFDAKSAVKLYESASEAQREIIDGMLVKKLKDEEASGIDFNIITQISKIGQRDIVKIAKDMKEIEGTPSE